jgi:hypothetical protein
LWLRGRTSVSVVSMEGKGFYEFRYLKHVMINLGFALNQGRLKVVTICVTEWGKWLVLFHISCQIYFEYKFVLCSDLVFFHSYAYIGSQFFVREVQKPLNLYLLQNVQFQTASTKILFFSLVALIFISIWFLALQFQGI